MRVRFPTGEVFNGPWTDDYTVSDAGLAYRRLFHGWVSRVADGTFRVNSGAFPPHRESLSVSVTLEQFMARVCKDSKELALSGHESTHGLAVFEVGVARSIGFMVR